MLLPEASEEETEGDGVLLSTAFVPLPDFDGIGLFVVVVFMVEVLDIVVWMFEVSCGGCFAVTFEAVSFDFLYFED